MSNNLETILDEIVSRNKELLHKNVEARRQDMIKNNIEHLELYEILGFSHEEGQKIDLYQNIGRFVYKYAGALVENATKAVLKDKKGGGSIRIPNTVSENPSNFEIDFYVDNDNKAHEIKWRDATTDGDHIKKELNKVKCIADAGMIPIKIMYYMPNRIQAIRIQERMINVFQEYGQAYVGRKAWDYINDYTGFNLYTYLIQKTKDIRI